MNSAIMSCLPCLFTVEEKQQASKPRARPELFYECNWDDFKLTKPGFMRSRFVQSYCDWTTQQWLADKEAPSVAKQAVSDLLAKVVGRTSANGLTYRGGMFVFSPAQLVKLLRCAEVGVTDADRQFPLGILPVVACAATATDAAKYSRNSIYGRYGLGAAVGPDPQEELRKILGHQQDKKNDDDDDDSRQRQRRDLPAAERVRQEEEKLVDEYRGKYGNLIDIGSGDGGVTKQAAIFFDRVIVTEENTVMRMRLKSVYGSDNVVDPARTSELLLNIPPIADSVSALNLLDRCDRPVTLLKEIRQALLNRQWLRDASDVSFQYSAAAALPPVLILAVVLPWCPFVESGADQLPPSERLPMEGGFCRDGATFEASLDRLVHNVLEPLGFRLKCWTRLPYLCEGDTENAYFKLEDAVMVLEASQQENTAAFGNRR